MSIFAKFRDFVRPKPLSCQQVNQFILDYLDGEMDDPTRIAFEAHLQNCPNCRLFVDQYRETTRLVRETDDIDIPPEVVERTIDFLRRRRYGEDGA